ncbi:dihydrofolate reductase family protein [Streptomyces sp. H27-D2]|uniref:dihydrofolate reductase family protein n=1 Tax=Streptomyces sp. H27-D2 TaxID=3046304 RepID=UPI002DBDB0F6|nr:dihydrofolate reductase family protein [Streptomyces sp. H27-D2]MEC4019805.1 dihydrofolate reductase family protein [Streptomyces sp. H27-D2]
MPQLRVHGFTISLDGFGAGVNQRRDAPFGDGVEGLHDWMFATRTARAAHGLDGGEEGLDDDFVARGETGIGATIIGRNMFGPIRGPWEDHAWTGWWGDNPPFHHDVFVLTHHLRPSFGLEGGTTFHFVDDGPEAVLRRAFEAADGQDVRLGGGAATIQQFLRAGLVDEMHVVIAPIMIGAGERLFDNLDGALERYECVEMVSSKAVTHARLTRRAAATDLAGPAGRARPGPK